MKGFWLQLALGSLCALSCSVNGESGVGNYIYAYEAYETYSAGYHYDPPVVPQSYLEIYGDYAIDHWVDELVCMVAENGTVLFNGTKPCSLQVSGADKLLNGTSGGIDGIYEPKACENGRPLYLRLGSPLHEDRVLAYSPTFFDWGLSNGTMLNDVNVWLYGGGLGTELLPPYLAMWSLANKLLKNAITSDEYAPSHVKITCTDHHQIAVENGSVDSA